MGDGLAIVAEEEVEAFGVGVAGAADWAEAPFSEGGGGVAGVAEDGGEGGGGGGDRVLAFFEFGEADGGLLVAADFGVAEVFTGEEDAAGGSADGSAAVVLGEAEPFGGEPVDVGRGDFLLAVASEFAPAEVVGEDEDDVWGRGGGGGWEEGGEEEQEFEEEETGDHLG